MKLDARGYWGEVTTSMAEAAFRPPLFKATDANACESWKEYKEDMNNYLVAAGLSDASGERKVAILLYGLGSKYRKIVIHSRLTL